MEFEFAALTDIGSTKNVNEDSYYIQVEETIYGEACLALVCDGVGGLEYGDRASRFVVNKFGRWFKRFACNRDLEFEKITTQVNEVIEETNHELVMMGKDAKTSLGTTISAILFIHGRYYVFHVGDTRIYQFGNRMKCLTFDHTVAAAKIRNGQLTEEEAERTEMKHILLQCVGADHVLEIQNAEGNYQAGDVYFLCSDGQYNKLNIGEIEDILEEMKEFDREEMQKMAETLIEEVKHRGETDNITTVFLKICE